MRMLGAQTEADHLLEQGVLADLKGEESYALLEKALLKLKELRNYMDAIDQHIGKLIEIDRSNKALPEHDTAIERILRNYPPIERVSLTNSRFANIGGGTGIAINYGPIGSNFQQLLENLQSDLKVLQIVTDRSIEAFSAVLPVAKKGGFAAIVCPVGLRCPNASCTTSTRQPSTCNSTTEPAWLRLLPICRSIRRSLEWIPKPP